VGATAKAVVNCLNFGNPEHPSVMWELSESIDGMAEACNELNLPVIGGNVSLYNESGGNDIDPTPVMGLLGVIDHLVAPPPGWNWRHGDTLVLVGARYAYGDAPFPLGGSRWATRRHRRGGHLTGVKPDALQATLPFVTSEVASICAGNHSDVTAVHDVGGGGLATALAEMVAVTGIGAHVEELDGHGELFSEFPGRFVMATNDPAAFSARAAEAGVPFAILGTTGGDRLTIGSAIDLSVEEIASRRAGALVDALEAN
jgi:phosphoribosylformylglycinamidine (FGAM) synthase-like enzyme